MKTGEPKSPDFQFSACRGSDYFDCVFQRSCFRLLMLKPAAHYRAEQKIVKLTGQTTYAQQGGDLRPVADFMQQDVNNDFPGCCSPNGIRKL